MKISDYPIEILREYYPDKTFAKPMRSFSATACREYWQRLADAATGRKAVIYRNRARFYPAPLPRNRRRSG